jgi:hypothetical protein
MYAYIYDTFTSDRKYSHLLYKIEKRLTDLNLNGKIIRLGISKNIKVAVDDEIRQGTKTIVAVGDDKTVAQVISAITGNRTVEKNQITLGIIPIAEKTNKIAAAFGIKSIGSACEILLARRLKTFQLAQINQSYFLFKTVLSAPNTILEIDKTYVIQNVKPVAIEVTNSPVWPEENLEEKRLKLRVYSKEGESVFSIKEMLIVNKDETATADDCLDIKTPARIKLSPEKIKIIVGKDRII